MTAWQQVTAYLALIPTEAWLILAAANLTLTAGTWSVARRRVRQAGERAARVATNGERSRARNTALTVASLVPAGLFFVMVLAGSFHGLVAFGRTALGWRAGWEYLVPGTLDGVSLTFAMLAFRAVRLEKTPDRCYRVVWCAAAASATINFAFEYGETGNILAGGYVGLLSLLAMVMFDEFLHQFEEGAGTIRRENPKFGIRWLTWPTNTFCAAIAWRNHPPAEGTPGTVLNAIANLGRVRALKRTARSNRHSERDQLGGGSPPPAPLAATASPSARLVTPANVGPSRSAAETVDETIGSPPAPASGEAEDGPGIRVPATAATVMQWINSWIAMCADPAVVDGALADDAFAMRRFGCRARQLRRIRYAATTGALRRRAEELAVDIPADYVETPLSQGLSPLAR